MLLLVLVVLSLFTACENDAPPDARPSRSPSPAPSGACANANLVVQTRGTRVGGTDVVDVSGDGRPDEVRLHVDTDEPVGCQAFLAVETGAGLVVAPVWETGETSGLPQPTLLRFVELDGTGGAEIVVMEAAGASTQFAGLHSMVDGSLVRIDFPGGYEGLFPFGGSVGHIEAVGCTEDGSLVVLEAVPGDSPEDVERQVYRVKRSTFSVSDAELSPEDVENLEIPLARFHRLPEFAAGPFGSCPAP